MSHVFLDPASSAGKAPAPAAHREVIVIGAGPAGIAAALAAARAGADTLLIDEHPLPAELMNLDVPLHFGQRMSAAFHDSQRLLDQVVASNPGIAAAFDAGVDVRLATCAWGVFANGPTVRTLAAPLVGLVEEARASFVSCDRLILACGARDLGIGFPGWEKPGVIGVQAATLLLQRYDAFNGGRLLIIGSDATALEFAALALERGLEVAGIVELESTASRTDEALQRLRARGVPIFDRHVIQEVHGSVEVRHTVLIQVDGAGKAIPGSEKSLDCDTVVCAVGIVPNIELLDALGCRMEHDAGRGGWIPLVDAAGATSVPGIYAVGDCAGLRGDAADEGRRAAGAALASLRVHSETRGAGRRPALPPESPGAATAAAWLQAQIGVSGWDVTVCQCEEVTRADVVQLRPPRYLGASPPAAHGLQALSADGPPNQDQVKRLTRAGMGPCQGRRCREQVQMLLAHAANTLPGNIPLARYRAPVRPLPLAVLASAGESPALQAAWVAWFNIATQWLPHSEPKPVPFPDSGKAPDIVPSGK